MKANVIKKYLIITVWIAIIVYAVAFTAMAVNRTSIYRAKDVIIEDVVEVEAAAIKFCKEDRKCNNGDALNWNDLDQYINNIDDDYYVRDSGEEDIAYYVNGLWMLRLTAKEIGDYEWDYNQISRIDYGVERREKVTIHE